MIVLSVINLLIAVLLLFAPIWVSRKLLDQNWLNPVSLMVFFMLPVEIFRLFIGQMFIGGSFLDPSNLMDISFQFAVLMTNLQQFIYFLMIIFVSRLRISHNIVNIIPQFGRYSHAELRRLSKVFFILYIAAFFLLAIRTGGVESWLSDIRGSYIEKRDGNGVFYAAALTFLSTSYFLEGVSNSRTFSFIFRSLIYFFAVYILGSKGFVLQFFIFCLIIILRQGRFHIGRPLLIAMPIAFLMLLINFTSNRETLNFSDLAEYFSHYPNAAMYYEDYFSGAIPLFYGDVFLTSFWEYVPRSLFPEKPYVYGIIHVVEIYFPGGAESGNTPSFYGGVSNFADFGVVGVLLFSLFNITPLINFVGLRYALKDRAFLNQGPMSGRTIVISLLLFAPAFGIFLPNLFLFFMVLFVIIVLKFMRSIKFIFI